MGGVILQLMLRTLSIVAATMAVPLMLMAAMEDRGAIDIIARGVLWTLVAFALWSIASVRQRMDDAGG